MDYKALANTVRKFANIDLLAAEIESLIDEKVVTGNEAETIDELTEFLETELELSN